MPYESRKTGKNEITVSKKGGGVVGHTTPEKFNAYMAALHIHSGDNAAQGGIVEEDEDNKEVSYEPQDLQRATHEDVSVYRKNPNPSPGVYRGKSAETIVPRDGEIDQEMGSYNKVAQIGDSRNMAMGGFVEPDDENNQIPPTPIPPQNIPTPPQPATPPPSPKLPGMPPGVTADQITPYLTNLKSQMNQYGPQAQMNLQRQTLADRNSFGNRLTSGLKGFGDALMQGVARAGNPGWQQAYESQQDERAREQMANLQKAGETNLQQTEAGMKMDMMRADSPISKSYQESFAPIFSKMGYKPQDVSKMSAAQVSTVADLATRYADSQTQLELKRAMMDAENTYKESMLGLETEKSKAAIQAKDEEQKQGALKQLGTMPWYSRILHRGEAKELRKQAGLDSDSEDRSEELGSAISGFLKTATNKKTGEKLGWDGKSWKPIP